MFFIYAGRPQESYIYVKQAALANDCLSSNNCHNELVGRQATGQIG